MPEATKQFTLEWDKAGERFYETGVSHGVFYPMTSPGTYGKGVAWNGLTAVTESPDGAEPTEFWADNIKYASIRSAESFKGTIEAYTYPDEFEECDGSATIAKGVKIGQQVRKTFGMCYRTEVGNDTAEDEDNHYKLHIVYGMTVSPSEKAYETVNDSPDAITFSWDFETMPVPYAGKRATACVTIDSKTANPTKLAELEKLLYGDGSADAQLPDIATIVSTMGTV